MSAAALRDPFDHRPIAREVLIAFLTIVGLTLWLVAIEPLAYDVADLVPLSAVVPADANSLVVFSLVPGFVLVLGMVAFAAAYVHFRSISVPVTLPDRTALPDVVLAVVVPGGLVVVATGLLGASDPTLAATASVVPAPGTNAVWAVDRIAALLLYGVPAYFLTAHVLVQRTLRRATDPLVAVGLTTLLFVPLDLTVGTNVLPVRMVAATALFALALALPVFAAHYFDEPWLPLLCAVPLAVLVGAVFLEFVGNATDPASAVALFAKVLVVAVGAYTYERTDSPVPPVLAYASFVATSEAMALVAANGGFV